MSEIFLDTETTGLSYNDGHKIVEVACIETADLVPTERVFHKLINPMRSVPEEAFKIQRQLYMKIKDFQMLDLDEDTEYENEDYLVSVGSAIEIKKHDQQQSTYNSEYS